jgi:hypothetical protein
MSNTEVPAPDAPDAGTEADVRSTVNLSVKSLGGNPRLIDDENRTVYFGFIHGNVTGVRASKSQNGDVIEAIMGSFEAVSSVVPGRIRRSGRLFLTTGAHEQVAAAASRLTEGNSISFAVEVFAVRAPNAAGYTWELRSALPATESDPLTEQRKAIQVRLAAAAAKRISEVPKQVAPEQPVPTEAAPAPATKKKVAEAA